MKDALKNDRARIQVGRISSFGLMEMSRQRLRTGVLEASTKQCPHCEGTGLMRTASSSGLSALRIIEDEAARGRGDRILLRAGREAAIYVLNRKRSELAEIEERYGVLVEVTIEESFEGARMAVESSGQRPSPRERPVAIAAPIDDEPEAEEDYLPEEEGDEVEIADDREPAASEDREERGERPRRDGEEGEGVRRRRRRRRGGRGRNRRDEEGGEARSDEPADVPAEAQDEGAEPVALRDDDGEERPRPRRGRRGGRSRRGGGSGEMPSDETPVVEAAPLAEDAAPASAEAEAEQDKPKTRRRPRARKDDIAAAPEATPVVPALTETSEPVAGDKPKRRSRARKADTPVEAIDAVEAPAEATAAPTPKARTRKAAPVAAEAATTPVETGETAKAADAEETGEPPRGGWWQRTFG
jgi:ribonuclease E